jgi:membrane-bound serine protease (ClpP class)
MKHSIRIIFFSLAFFLGANLLAKKSEEKSYVVNNILSLSINSSINPATYSYFESGFKEAEKKNFDLILIKINTPGGLVSTTKNILTLFGNSSIPVAVWVAPEGASATSAGAIIASGAHVLMMANGTNIGAATPINLGADGLKKDMRNKAINDLVALVSSLAETRGRNTKMFAKMIEDASSYTSQKAKAEGIVDGIANTNSEALKIIDNAKINLKGESYLLKVDKPLWHIYEMDLGQKLLDIFAHPHMAYILFILGAALLYLEFQAAGSFVAGGIGILCLILAGIGFQVLPLNFGALGLIVLSFVLFVLEIYVVSYGILSLAGVASLVTGSMFLFRTDDAYLSVSYSLIYTIASVIMLFMLILGCFLFRDFKRFKNSLPYYSLVDKEALIIEVLEENLDSSKFIYHVKVSGEIWKASSNKKYQKGERVKVKKSLSSAMELIV